MSGGFLSLYYWLRLVLNYDYRYIKNIKEIVLFVCHICLCFVFEYFSS